MKSRISQNLCKKAILETLKYRALFNYPLSFYQLSNYLITSRTTERDLFDKELKILIDKKKVIKKHDKYTLPKTKFVNWRIRKEQTQKIIKENTGILKLIGKIPWVKMISITGSVAMYNAKEVDDIDIFIVSAKDRVWLTRGFSGLLLMILGKFPKEDGEQGKFCPNIYVDETALEWEKQNIFTAHEVVSMIPIISKGNTYFKFMKANEWALKYFKNFKIEIPERFEKEVVYKSKLVDLLENLAMKVQLLYMEKKVSTEIRKKHLIHFNKNDNQKKILETYSEKLNQKS